MKAKSCLALWLTAVTLLRVDAGAYHPCLRVCDGLSRTCNYNFTLEWYNTLTVDCLQCPQNASDCDQPNCIAANGLSRAMVTVNRQLPGPDIHVCRNDVVVVNVYNRMIGSDGTSIHWHGVFQKDTPYMDGANMITQCAILPHNSFRYRFRAANSGTHFWHAHAGVQRADGVVGALVVRDTSDPHQGLYDFDLPEHAVIVQDWLNELAIQILARSVLNDNDGTPTAIVINGRGRYRSAGLNTTTPLSVFTVKPGFRHRFRVINNGILHCPIQISVDGHSLTMIASDGNPFAPVSVESFAVFAGERYDFVLDANRSVDNYWLRAKGLADCAVNGVYELAVVRYEGARDEEPAAPTDYGSAGRVGKALNLFNTKSDDVNMHVGAMKGLNSEPDRIKGVPDVKKYLVFDRIKMDDLLLGESGGFEYTGFAGENINFITNMHPPSPLLYQYRELSQDMFCNEDTVRSRNCSWNQCDCVHLVEVKVGQLVEFVLIGSEHPDILNHPTHLHGYSFHVVAMEMMNSNTTVEERKAMDAAGAIRRNLVDPVRKDTIPLASGGYAVIRFRADNPGSWFLHCHLEFHAEGGMSLTLKVGEPSEWAREPANWPHCGSQSQTASLVPPPPPAKRSAAPLNTWSFALSTGCAGWILVVLQAVGILR